jgi:branched-chain amino acid transport system substrate-binding protein
MPSLIERECNFYSAGFQSVAAHNTLRKTQSGCEAQTGITPDAFALSAYDALFVVQRALEDARGTKNFANFKAAFVNEADAYVGVTGSTALDAAGDRLNGDFDFWAIRLQNGSYGWMRVGTYRNGTLTLF